MKKPPLEKAIVNRVLKMLSSRGGFAVKIHGSPLQVGGLPDIFCCYRGRFVAFEVKRAAGIEPSPLQQYQLDRTTAAGGIAAVVHSVQQAEAILDRIDEEL
jgi:hypothetical protein